jgi:hypothetical protein
MISAIGEKAVYLAVNVDATSCSHASTGRTSPPSASMSASSRVCDLMPTCSSSRQQNARAAAGLQSKESPTKSSPHFSRIAKFRGNAVGSACGTAEPIASWKSQLAQPSGIIAAFHPSRSAGCWFAILPVSSTRKPSLQPISTPSRKTSSAGSSADGRSKSHSRKCARISASKPSVSGPIRPSCALSRLCSPCSRSSPCGRTISQAHKHSNQGSPHGIQNQCSPSATLSRQCAAKYGVIKFPPCRGPAEI